jgi:hypothetical protein
VDEFDAATGPMSAEAGKQPVGAGVGDVDLGNHVGHPPLVQGGEYRPITDEGVAVGGAFGSDTATGMTPMAHCVAGVLAFQ